MAFVIERFNSIHKIDETRWNALTAGRPFTSHAWLAFCERVQADDEPVYLILKSAEADLGAAVFWLRSKITIPDLPAIPARLLAGLIRRRRLMICEIPVSETPGLILPEEPSLANLVLTEISSEAARIGQNNAASFLIFGYLMADQSVMEGWPSDYRQLKLYPGTLLDLQSVSEYGEYSGNLNQKRRKNIRRNLEAAAAEGLTVVSSPGLDIEQALRLIETTVRRHDGRLPVNMRNILANTDQVPSRWLVAEVEGQVAGFDLLLGDRGHWLIRATGNNYIFQHVYFLLTDSDIRAAIQLGAKKLYGGTHLYEYKSRVGFDTQQNGFVRAKGLSLFFDAVLKFIARRFDF